MRFWLWVITLSWGVAGWPGCAAGPTGTAARPGTPINEAATKPLLREAGYAQDRSAILALAGEYLVEYRYEETVALREGYELASPYVASATELVLVVEDGEDRVVLQHLLLIGEPARVVKHWQQAWEHRPGAAVQWVDENLWQRRAFVGGDRPGVWSRTVTEADGAPGYASWGRWSHRGGVSSWSSSTAVFAPPPRREAVRADQYAALSVSDRVTITPDGWVQEQQITKGGFAVDAPALARESGVVRYRRADGAIDFSQARAYWQRVGPYWAQVRRAWDAVMADGGAVSLREQVDGQPRWRRLFTLADSWDGSGDGDAVRHEIESVLSDYVVRP